MLKNAIKVPKIFGFGKKKSEESNERSKREDDIHIEICQLSDNE